LNASQEEIRQPLTEHLSELRTRLIRSLIAFAIGTGICYNYSGRIYQVLIRPVVQGLPEGSHLVFTELTEAFLTYFKLSLWGGFLLASPVIFHQMWCFISPGLYRREQKLVAVFAFWSTISFAAGTAFAYFIAVPAFINFFFSFGKTVVTPLPSMKESLSLVLRILLIFGVMFELPIFFYFMGRGGILPARIFRKWRKAAILGSVVLAAVLTPPDIVSQLMLAVPLYALYELGIILCAVGERRSKAALTTPAS
jgi:sec-independent protein translocase protein TatC